MLLVAALVKLCISLFACRVCHQSSADTRWLSRSADRDNFQPLWCGEEGASGQLSRSFDGVNAVKYLDVFPAFMLAYRKHRDAIGDVEVKVVFVWTLAPGEPNGAPFLGSTTSAVHHALHRLGLISLLLPCRSRIAESTIFGPSQDPTATWRD